MSKKALCILSGIFIILAIAASSSWWSGYLNFMKPSSPDAELDFSPFTRERTEKIIITKRGQEVKILTKENSKWNINSFDASSKAIDDFFETLKTLKVGLLVSKNPENHADLGIDDDGYALTLVKSGQETNFIIGSRDAPAGLFYARKKDARNVYLAEGALSDMLAQSVSYWRDKTLINIPGEAIQKIEIISKTNPLLITKTKNNTWQAKNTGKTAILDEATITHLLRSLNPLEGSDFMNKKQEGIFQSAKNKTVLRVFDAQERKLTEIQLLENDADWLALVEGKDIYYQVPSYKLSGILLTHEKVFGQNKK